MKNTSRILCWYIAPVLCALLAACGDAQTGKASLPEREDTAVVPASGTVIAADSMRITDDLLNLSYFSVRVVANDYSAQGTYTIQAAYGYNTAESMMTMPRGGAHLRPMLRKGKEPYTYILYFLWQGKPYDYFLVQARRGEIRMQHTNAYVLDEE